MLNKVQTHFRHNLVGYLALFVALAGDLLRRDHTPRQQRGEQADQAQCRALIRRTQRRTAREGLQTRPASGGREG